MSMTRLRVIGPVLAIAPALAACDGVAQLREHVVCGTAEFEGGPVACRGKAIPAVRALSDNTFYIRRGENDGPCTGWLVGTADTCGQYAITNAHCLGNPAAMQNTSIEFFKRETLRCTTGRTVYSENADTAVRIANGSCEGAACPLKFIATGSDGDLDYTILRIDSGLPRGAAGLAVCTTAPRADEQLLLVGHPTLNMANWQAVSVLDEGNAAQVTWRAGVKLGYRLDTEDGNSGSPVWSRDRRQVIGIHATGDGESERCRNEAIAMSAVLADRPVRDPSDSTRWDRTTAAILRDGVASTIGCARKLALEVAAPADAAIAGPADHGRPRSEGGRYHRQ